MRGPSAPTHTARTRCLPPLSVDKAVIQHPEFPGKHAQREGDSAAVRQRLWSRNSFSNLIRGFRRTDVAAGIALGWCGVATPPAAFGTSIAVLQTPSIFSPASTPADSIHRLSLLVLAICSAIFLVVFSLLVYSVIRF